MESGGSERWDGGDVRIWALVGVYLAVAALAFTACGFRIAPGDAFALGGLGLLGCPFAVVLAWRLPDQRWLRVIGGFFQHGAYGAASAMLSYCAARGGRPLADGALLSIDRALGYDWESYVAAVVAHPAIERLLDHAYEALFWQMAVVVVIDGLDRDRTRLQRFIAAHVFTLWITIGLFALWPVTTSWVHLGWGAADLRNLHLSAGGWPVQLLALRAGDVTTVTTQSNFAIIGFPSYHCAAGVLNVWAAWRTRWLRVPMLAAVAVMIAATPINGGHYVIDVIAGILVAAAGMMTACWFVALPAIMPRWRRFEPATPALSG